MIVLVITFQTVTQGSAFGRLVFVFGTTPLSIFEPLNLPLLAFFGDTTELRLSDFIIICFKLFVVFILDGLL